MRRGVSRRVVQHGNCRVRDKWNAWETKPRGVPLIFSLALFMIISFCCLFGLSLCRARVRPSVSILACQLLRQRARPGLLLGHRQGELPLSRFATHRISLEGTKRSSIRTTRAFLFSCSNAHVVRMLQHAKDDQTKPSILGGNAISPVPDHCSTTTTRAAIDDDH